MLASFIGEIAAGIVYGPRPPSDPASAAYFGSADPSQAGTLVNEWTALNISALFSGTRFIAETLASLPFHLYRRLPGGGKEKATKHPCYKLVHRTPNAEMTSMSWREAGFAHDVLWGNQYSEIERDLADRPIGLWTITPNRCLPDRDDGPVYYRVTEGGMREYRVKSEDMLHVPGIGFDGLVGYNVVTLARESLGLTVALERNASSYFGNGSRPGGILKHPGRLKETAQNNLRSSWERMHQGPYKSGRVAILQEGMEWQALSFSPEDSQHLESRQFSLAEIARWLRIPPHLLYDLSKSTNNNIEFQGMEAVVYSLRPWAVRLEQECNRKLLTEAEQEDYFFDIDFDALLRGDRESRYRAYSIGRQWGWLSANDVCEEENRNPIGEDGDVYLVPGNMTTPEKMLAEPEPAPPGQAEPKVGEVGGKPNIQPPPRGPAKATILAAKRVLLDGLARLQRKECQAARRAANDPGRFLAWLDEFYPKHESLMTQALVGPAQLVLSLAGRQDAPESIAGNVATAHCKLSRDELLSASECQPSKLVERVSLVCDRWEQERPAEVAAEFFRTEFDEDKVTRDDHGRFSEGGGGDGKQDKETSKEDKPKLAPIHQEMKDKLANDKKGNRQVERMAKIEATLDKATKEADGIRHQANVMEANIIERSMKGGEKATEAERTEHAAIHERANKIENDALDKARTDMRAALKTPDSKTAITAIHKYGGMSDGLANQVDKAEKFLANVVSMKAAGGLYFSPKVKEQNGEHARAYYQDGHCYQGKHDDASIVVHEMGHHLNETPAVKDAVQRFLNMRIDEARTPTVPMQSVARWYGKGETGNKDSFDKLFPSDTASAHYTGARYSGGQTEVISMGLQELHANPARFARRDPEFFKFITGVLDGRHLDGRNR